jgi:hypothetical protein
MARMSLPDWRTSTAGTRVRVALWLATEVGTGEAFTKAQLRDAFPGVEQVDRRMRDLRADGWIIATYREDRSLASDELRLVMTGGQVWEPGYRSKASAPGISDKQRHEIFAADGFVCIYCGIGGGEGYPDDQLRTAKLTIARAKPADDSTPRLSTVCDRCHLRSSESASEDAVASAIAELDPESRRLLREWIMRGRRSRGPVDELWAEYRRLPSADRARIKQLIVSG